MGKYSFGPMTAELYTNHRVSRYKWDAVEDLARIVRFTFPIFILAERVRTYAKHGGEVFLLNSPLDSQFFKFLHVNQLLIIL